MAEDLSTASPAQTLLRTPFHDLHQELGARMAAFAGYDMPVQYSEGIVAEHTWTRENAGLFDVSHMGQAVLEGPGAAAALETLVAAEIVGLPERRTRYTQFLNDDGGILDDLMVTRLPARAPGEDCLFLVVNAACKEADFALLRERLPHLGLTVLSDRVLIALQGPKAVEVIAAAGWPGVATLPFMGWASAGASGGPGADLWFSRSGYTGEDGFEISVGPDTAASLAHRLLKDERVKLIGLGARDSLRLEAGLCLYGHDIDEATSPVEAGLSWSIGKRRRTEGGFPGFERIARELRDGPARTRVGLLLEGRQPAREGAEIIDAAGAAVGRVTSGGFAPSLGRAIAMGYVAAGCAAPGAALSAVVRGKPLPARVVPLPFVPNKFVR